MVPVKATTLARWISYFITYHLKFIFICGNNVLVALSRSINFRLGQGEISRMNNKSLNNYKRGPHHRPTIIMNDFVFPVFDCYVLLYYKAFTTQNRKSCLSNRNKGRYFFPHDYARIKTFSWKQMHFFAKIDRFIKLIPCLYFQVQGHKLHPRN